MYGNDPWRVRRDIRGRKQRTKGEVCKGWSFEKKVFLKKGKATQTQREKRIESDLRSEVGAKHLDFSSQFHPH